MTEQAPLPPVTGDGNAPEVVGIVFVHGVGFQQRAETLTAWLRPLVRHLRDAAAGPNAGRDPVTVAYRSERPEYADCIELAIPGSDSHKPQRWLVTEAWWADSIRPPTVAAIVSWLTREGGISQMADLITGRTLAEPVPRERRTVTPAEVLVGVVATFLVLMYSLLRAIFAILPIQRVREALLGPIDRLLTSWAGDMRVLIGDEAQAAHVRAQIAGAAQSLVARGCDRIVLVAHSGGAVASYMTLTDPTHMNLPVTKLITLGQGLNIAWRLTGARHRDDPEIEAAASRLLDPISQPNRPVLWFDYWASRDPVPAGPVRTPPIGTSSPLTKDRDTQMPLPVPMAGESGPGVRVSNLESIGADHGGYFDNDEEFVVRLLRHLDTPGGTQQSPASAPTPKSDD